MELWTWIEGRERERDVGSGWLGIKSAADEERKRADLRVIESVLEGEKRRGKRE